MRAMEYTPVQCRCEPMGQWTLVQWCLIHRTQIEPTKKLTDAECAAEYWRAMHEFDWAYDFFLKSHGDPELRQEADEWDALVATWHRFATQPHASEVEA